MLKDIKILNLYKNNLMIAKIEMKIFNLQEILTLHTSVPGGDALTKFHLAVYKPQNLVI